jgi:hypothetical protein
MIVNAIKIQINWKRFRNLQKLKDKLAQKKKASLQGELWDSDSDDNDEYNRDNYHLELQLRKIASQSHYSQNKKKKATNKSHDKENMTNKIKNEKDPNKIIDMILFDKGLNEENRELTNLLIDQKNLASSSSFIQKVRKNFFDEEKIENKLLKYGEIKKNRETQEIINKLKKEEENLTFKPKINNNVNVNYKYPSNFLKRVEFYKLFKERNIENLRNHYKKKDENFSFRPKVSAFANSIRNVFDRLYNEELVREKQQRQMLNDINPSFETPNSNNKKLENINLLEIHKPKKPEEIDENIIDLWPLNYSKKF